jgi:hypothetical protein
MHATIPRFVAAVIFQLVNPPMQITPIATDAPPYETPAVAVGRVLLA